MKWMNFGTIVNDTTTGSSRTFAYKLKQRSIEYSIIGGNRVFLSGKSDQPGWTFDFFAGLGIGKLLENKASMGGGYFPLDEIFLEIPRDDIYFTGKLGLSLGYIF